MRLVGYCTECRRIRRVRVYNRPLPSHNRARPMYQGICDECKGKHDAA